MIISIDLTKYIGKPIVSRLITPLFAERAAENAALFVINIFHDPVKILVKSVIIC